MVLSKDGALIWKVCLHISFHGRPEQVLEMNGFSIWKEINKFNEHHFFSQRKWSWTRGANEFLKQDLLMEEIESVDGNPLKDHFNQSKRWPASSQHSFLSEYSNQQGIYMPFVSNALKINYVSYISELTWKQVPIRWKGF